MAILINDNYTPKAPKPIDDRYGPYASTTAALAAVASTDRHKGLTLGILNNGSVVEYWFRDDITNTSLIIKDGGSAGGTFIMGDNTIVKMIKLTESEYNNLANKDATTLYVIVP